MSEILFKSPFGEFECHRIPKKKRETLRAWDAADELMLNTLKADIANIDKPLICNDSFGALSVALHQFNPSMWSDSSLSHRAVRKNLESNKLDRKAVIYLNSLERPKNKVKLMLIKIPKTLALLEDQLIRIRPLLDQDSQVIVAGMVKYMPASIWKLLERILGPTTTSRAVKKARLIHVEVDPNLKVPENPYPVSWPLENTDFYLSNHANVFSRDKLDVGTRFMLQHLPETDGEGDIIDLGCGNGVLGLIAAQQNPHVKIHFVDESYMAIASAKENFKQIDGQGSKNSARGKFYVANGLHKFESASADLVLCNPPFHQQQAVGDGIAKLMLRESARVLRAGAELWVVSNRHLGYHQAMRKYFDRIHMVASNKKFIILKASLLASEA